MTVKDLPKKLQNEITLNFWQSRKYPVQYFDIQLKPDPDLKFGNDFVDLLFCIVVVATVRTIAKNLETAQNFVRSRRCQPFEILPSVVHCFSSVSPEAYLCQ